MLNFMILTRVRGIICKDYRSQSIKSYVMRLGIRFGKPCVNCEAIRGKSDREIWDYAKANVFTIVTCDEDFWEIQLLRSFP